MAAIPQSAFAVRKIRNTDRAVSMSVKGEKGKNEEKKENIFNSRPHLEGINNSRIAFATSLFYKFNFYNRKEKRLFRALT